MNTIAGWISENQVLSGVGGVVLGGIGYIVRRLLLRNEAEAPSVVINNTNTNTLSAVNGEASPMNAGGGDLKNRIGRELVRILFIDDDTRFRVVKMLKGAGWPNVKITRDIRDLGAPEVVEAQILFVDIQGVGKALGFSDEGLGLALALKEKYPDKKVVIYSAQTDGDRFHRALNKADGALPKNADPYQFISLVEELMG